MKNPTKEQVQIVIDTFQNAHDKAILNGIDLPLVNMLEFSTQLTNSMCHGGWYAYNISEESFMFYEAKILISQDLGFESESDLKKWTFKKPVIWGNNNGVFMFSDGKAFGQVSNIFPLQIIIDYWRGVQSRLPE